MRILAALGVAQFHLWQNYFGITIGHPGTDFFLVLVGVVAALNQASQIPGGNWWGYISDRYKRLYVTFVPLFVITLLVKWTEADASWVVRSFLFLPISDRLPVIGSTWMLSMFVLFYFIFSICFLLRTEKLIWILFGVWLTLIVAYSFGNWIPGLPEEWANLFFSKRNISLMMGYVVGTILRHEWLQNHHAVLSLWIGLAGIILGTILLNSEPTKYARLFTLDLPIAFFVLGVATLEQKNSASLIVRLLTSPGFVWLGGTSYVLYLSHSLFFKAWSLLLPVTLIYVLPMTIGAIIVGALGYVFWEQPILTYLKKGRWEMPQLPFINRVRYQNTRIHE